MLARSLALPLHRATHAGAAVLVQGPRGAGKTHLLRREFPAHRYIALDEAAARAAARRDPAGFLGRLRGPAIIDDLHRAPELVAFIGSTDEHWPVVFASSRRLSVPLKTLELYSPSRAEVENRHAVSLAMLGRFAPALPPDTPATLQWPNTRSFLEHDVRDLINVHDLDRFESFLHIARATSAAVLDQQVLARACEISHRTVARWLAVLDSCFLTLIVRPADEDFGRRLVRRPKLHFFQSDSFESQAVCEIYRNARHAGVEPDLRFWRDSNGMEVQLVVQSEDANPLPISIAPMVTPGEIARLRRWMELAGVSEGAVVALTGGRARTGGVLRYGINQL